MIRFKKNYTLPQLTISEFDYELPEDKIAKFPLAERDASKLLVYKNNHIRHQQFYYIDEFLDANYTLFFNNTKVIPARLYFQRETGAAIEVLLLSPLYPSVVVHVAMQAQGESIWECTIGNLKRWRENETLQGEFADEQTYLTVKATLRNKEKKIVHFSWQPTTLTFAEVLGKIGDLPLPPYLRRETTKEDFITYQTIYGKKEGAIAAPTAGLHFTERVIEKIRKKGVAMQELTLHVSAGTFRPISTSNAAEHQIHLEQVIISRRNVEEALKAKKIAAVGTTSMRTLESLYWYGVKLLLGDDTFDIDGRLPYQLEPDDLPSRQKSMQTVLDFMQKTAKTELIGKTGIYIYPGYVFRMCDALITNFHQPKSTLILLVAAFVGNAWKDIYREALEKNYRFLSYGDSSLLFKD